MNKKIKGNKENALIVVVFPPDHTAEQQAAWGSLIVLK